LGFGEIPAVKDLTGTYRYIKTIFNKWQTKLAVVHDKKLIL
jgi:hypothetical protein